MTPLFLTYGKIIIDTIQLRGGGVARSTLGGGGPQAAFGMRLWQQRVALLTRSGADLSPDLEAALRSLDLDLSGWARYDDLPTPHGVIEYDENERMLQAGLVTSRADWYELLGRPLALSAEHRAAAAIHLVTEFGAEPMAQQALELQRGGALFSLEPILDAHSCPDQAALLDLARRADLVTPDWPAATAAAGADEPAAVLRHWAGLGPRAIAIRRGSYGSYVWDAASGRAWHIPPLPITVVDPTGAGNAYGGGWCVGWHASGDARIAGCYASASAALLVEHPGIPPLGEAARARAAELRELALAAAAPLAI